MAVLETLFVKLGYDVDQKKIDDFNLGVEKTAAIMKKVVLRTFAAATALGLMARQVSKTQTATANTAATLGMTANAFETARRAAADLTGDADQATTALSRLNDVQTDYQRKIGRKAPGADFLTALAELDIKNVDAFLKIADPAEALDRLNLAFNQLQTGTAQKFDIAERLGLGGAVNLLITERKKFVKAMTDNKTSIDFESIKKVNLAFTDFTQSMADLANIFTSKFSTEIRAVVNWLTNLATVISDFIGLDRTKKLNRLERRENRNRQQTPVEHGIEPVKRFFSSIFDALKSNRISQGTGGHAGRGRTRNQNIIDKMSGLPGNVSPLGNAGGAQSVVVNQTNNINQNITGIDGPTAMDSANRMAAKKASQQSIEAINSGFKK